MIPFHPSISRKLIVLLFVLWLFSVNYKTIARDLFSNKFFIILSIFFAYLLISLLWSENLYGGYKHLQRFFIFLYFPIVLIVTSLNKKNIKYVLSAFLFSMFINEIISYGIYFELWSTKFGTPINPVPFQKSHLSYSVFVAVSIILSIYNYYYTKNLIIKFIYTFFMITMSINLFMSEGRTGQFALVLAFLIALVYFNKNKPINILLGFVVLITICVSAYFNINTFNNRVNQFIDNSKQMIYHNQYNTSWGGRIGPYKAVPTLMNRENIIFGEGIGDSEKVISKYPELDYISETLHNMYLFYLHSAGIVAFALSLLIFYFLFMLKVNNFIYLKFMFTTLFAIICLTGNFFYNHETALLFALFTSIFILDREEKNTLNFQT